MGPAHRNQDANGQLHRIESTTKDTADTLVILPGPPLRTPQQAFLVPQMEKSFVQMRSVKFQIVPNLEHEAAVTQPPGRKTAV